MRSRALRVAAALLSTMLAGCAPLLRGPAQAPAAPPADFPEAYYRDAAAQGKPVFRVDSRESLVVIEVRRSGSLARLGHDHVVASHEVGGYVAPDDGRAELYVALARLTVDEAELRAEAGFDTQPAGSDIEGTRANMLDKVLDAERFPFALIRVNGADATQGDVTLSVAITLRGSTRTLQVPARIEADAEKMSVAGEFAFDQTDFGITPYSLLGGAIAVKNRVELRFRIRARRLSGAG
ncbi:MAG TPA: YceI family protein [Burkholderiales bacterium]|nr:YceI family protein [Burkholderiales bacterium]